jgi:hypothetical protein
VHSIVDVNVDADIDEDSSDDTPLRGSTFFASFFNMKCLSNLISFDFYLKIKFDRDFIVKMMQ